VRKVGWPPDWNAEYAEMMEEVIAESPDSAERIAAFLSKLHDAVQAHRQWAVLLDADIRRRGAGSEVSGYAKGRVPRLPVAYDGRLLTQDAVAGFKRTRGSGEQWVAQELVAMVTWDELRAKRAEQLAMEQAYGVKVAMYDKLLALRDMAPQAANPAEACTILGLSIDDYLGGEALAA
jgi:hypothetical protein